MSNGRRVPAKPKQPTPTSKRVLNTQTQPIKPRHPAANNTRTSIPAAVDRLPQAAPTVRETKQAARAAKTPQVQQPWTIFPPHLSRVLSAKAVEKANASFKNFSLSKFPKDSMPPNYVPKWKTRGEVHRAQRHIITQHLPKLRNTKSPNQGMTLSLPARTIKGFLPSFDAKTATIDLSDVMRLIANNTRTTEFYANGNATLNRIALQARAQNIIAAIKRGRKT